MIDKKIIYSSLAIVLVIIIGAFFYVNSLNKQIEEIILQDNSSQQTANFEQKKIDFQTILKGSYSSHKNSKNYVINSVLELNNALIQANLTFQRNMTPINFRNETLIASFFGEVDSGGYSIDISSIIENENQVIINVIKRNPTDPFVTTAFTQPYHIIRTKKIDKEILFNVTEI